MNFYVQIDLFFAKQFLFQRQWQNVRNYAEMKGISIMGDMPIYVGYHSANVWANRKHFLLVSFLLFIFSITLYYDIKYGPLKFPIVLITNICFHPQNRHCFPLLVSGVPPDAFSDTGQLWGRLSS